MVKIEANKIYRQDCLEFMKTLPDKYFDLILTDPPYGIGIGNMNFTKSTIGGVAKRTDYTKHDNSWDNEKLGPEYFKEMIRVSKNQIIFGAEHLCSNLPTSRGWIVWDKKTEDKYENDFASCELAWTSFDKPTKLFRYLWNGMMQDNMKYKEKRIHPTQKPVALGRWILDKYAESNQTVFDPFAGSGSFLLAAKQKGLVWVGCELNKEYVELANSRLKQENLLNF